MKKQDTDRDRGMKGERNELEGDLQLKDESKI